MLIALIQQHQRQQQARMQEEAMRHALAIVNGIVAFQQQPPTIKQPAAPSFVLTSSPTTNITLAVGTNPTARVQALI